MKLVRTASLLLTLLVPATALAAIAGGLSADSPSTASSAITNPSRTGGDSPFIDKYMAAAKRQREDGELDAAQRALERVLERDDQHLGALKMLAEVATELGNDDVAVYSYHRWLSIVDASERPPVPKAERKTVMETLLLLDARAEDFRKMSEKYIKDLLKLAKDYQKKKNAHSALAIYQQILGIDRMNRDARAGIKKIRTTGGNDLATEDVYGGQDPTFGVSPEWIAEQDAKHDTWKTAWTKDGENYRYKTDAGFLVLQTASIAMEQMNGFYRQFFRYKMDGSKTPKIDVNIFKNRDEYLELGIGPPVEWSGGHFTGGAVETYVGGTTGKESIRQMYGTLFHEAAHQFVSLTGKGGVPGWLNEAYASFFEGVTILSNGSVKWNQVANHRLFPLANRMDRGWMVDHTDGVRDESGEWSTPQKAPTFRIIVEDKYQWGPPWYAPTWGVVYFLYNYRDDEGRPVYRDNLHEYYLSNAAGRSEPVAHFEEIVLSAPNSPVKTIDELNELWRTWILDLRDIQLGKKKSGKSNLDNGKAAKDRGDDALALEFFEEAYTHRREDPEVVWQLAVALEEQGNDDRAAALYRDFSRELELRGLTEDERYEVALAKQKSLDAFYKRYAKMKDVMQRSGLALAKSYRDRELPLMALEITRRMSANYSMPEALAFYEEVAREYGKSLARWKVAYNEYDLSGWAGGDGYRAYGKMIEAYIEPDPGFASAEGTFFTRELAADVTFDSDFSLEAEMRFKIGDSTLMGLCFGRKDPQNTHAVVLHPKGYLDISSKVGGSWTVRDHRSVKIGNDWVKLRIDVVDDMLDVYLNDKYVRSMQMPSKDSVRGAFGLITGVGTCYFQDVRVLARDPHDPAARIEREIALKRISEDPGAREEGVFAGIEAPPAKFGTWIQGEPIKDLTDFQGRPALLFFWTPNQDKVIPTAEYYRHLASEYGEYGVHFLAIVNNEHRAEEVRTYLQEHPMPGVRIVMDTNFKTYHDYNIKPGGWGMPRILLLDVDGTVIWEGDPGFKIGVGWDPGAGETFLDGPVKDLVEQRQLAKLAELAGSTARGLELYEEGDLKGALEVLDPIANLTADFDAEVKEARRLRDSILSLAEQIPYRADEHLAAGHPLTAQALLETALREFGGTSAADLAQARLTALQKNRVHKEASKAWAKLEKAVNEAQRGRDNSRILPHLDGANSAAERIPQIKEALEALKTALFDEGPQAMVALWPQLQPKGTLDLEEAASQR